MKISEIVNTRPGELTVRKYWVDRNGNQIPGEGSVELLLKRMHYVRKDTAGDPHTISISLDFQEAGYGTPGPVSGSGTVYGDTVTIRWPFGGADPVPLTYSDSSVVETFYGKVDDGMTLELVLTGVTQDLTIEGTVPGSLMWVKNNGNIYDGAFTFAGAPVQWDPEPDGSFAGETIVLSDGNLWTRTLTIGGSDAVHEGADYPEKDNSGNPYHYYVVETDGAGHEIPVNGTPAEGYVLGLLPRQRGGDQPGLHRGVQPFRPLRRA